MNRKGLSVVELLVVLVIIGIIAAMLPFILGGRRSLELNRFSTDLNALLQQSRFEAIKRNRPVFVVVQGSTVLAFVDLNRNGTVENNESATPRWTLRLSDYQPVPTLSTDLGNASNRGLRWTPDGLVTQIGSTTAIAPGKFVMTLNGRTRLLCISAAGRIRPADVPTASDNCPSDVN
jgi:prepilin-type N-terminal cleavage/methylation domain-containing protein